MRRNRIAEGWNSFSLAVLHENTLTIQRQEMRRAFYAGVDVLFHIILANLSEGPDAKDSDVTMLDDLQKELESFAASVREGRA